MFSGNYSLLPVDQVAQSGFSLLDTLNHLANLTIGDDHVGCQNFRVKSQKMAGPSDIRGAASL
ncbi:hypothetical protein A5782_08465 [Mycobacterium sp. 852002-40037_SCH5390672]|nr:hypothetical protein A5782_08465 [Mycobacterium sp. 852002-40037_SCH5390672]